MTQDRKTWFEGETGKFVSKNASATLSYAILDGIYYLEHLDDEGLDFLISLDFGYEIALHKNNGEKVNMVVVDIVPLLKAKVKP